MTSGVPIQLFPVSGAQIVIRIFKNRRWQWVMLHNTMSLSHSEKTLQTFFPYTKVCLGVCLRHYCNKFIELCRWPLHQQVQMNTSKPLPSLKLNKYKTMGNRGTSRTFCDSILLIVLDSRGKFKISFHCM